MTIAMRISAVFVALALVMSLAISFAHAESGSGSGGSSGGSGNSGSGSSETTDGGGGGGGSSSGSSSASSDDGTADQGKGDADEEETEVHNGADDGTADQGHGDAMEEEDEDTEMGDDRHGSNSGPGNMNEGEDNSGHGNAHKSAVAEAVAELLKVADRAGTIGVEIREVAQEQKDADEEVSDALDKVASRPGFLIFLFGTDEKSLGVLRSSLQTTEQHIDRLEKAKERTAGSIATDLDEQIAALQEEHDSIEALIKEQEGSFSLFGWLLKLVSGE